MATRDLWHLGFARLVRQRAPPGFLVRAEVPLSDEPQRADLILIRREDVPRRDEQAQLLRALWPYLGADTVLEFKSPVRGFRRNDLKRLASYGAQYHVLEDERLLRPADLTLVLVIPSRTGALDDEIARMGWRLVPLDQGYGRIEGGVYTLFLVLTDDVSEAERDDFLRIFSHHDCQTDEATWWWSQWRAEDTTMNDVKELEGYDEMVRKFASGLTPEQALAGLSREKLRGHEDVVTRFVSQLPLAQQLLGLSDETLRAFPDEYLRGLAPELQAAIRKRIGRPSA
ncbi:MAG: hypothetical protein ABJE95_23780 [Byssovorax sp.]